jgi:23S rRNA (adenine2503-C2)-methyltransferase
MIRIFERKMTRNTLCGQPHASEYSCTCTPAWERFQRMSRLRIQPGLVDAPPTDHRLHLFGIIRDELRERFARSDYPAYRADQVLDWIYGKQVLRLDAMTNLPKDLRVELAQTCAVYRSIVSHESISQDGAHKLLLTWPDRAAVEAVWIPANDRHTACLSSQVGCPVGCRFCASGLDGVQRNLTTGEIVEQAMRIARSIQATEPKPNRQGAQRLSHVVLMGMGEPLANYGQVIRAIRILNAPWGMNTGARRITLSTVGLPKQIRQLAQEGLQINLALSLHAPDEGLRRELIPWARGIRLCDLLDACAYYFRQTGREITLEYVLLDGVNTSARQADALAKIARRLRANVNLLRYNPVPGLPYQRPSGEAAYRFQARLRDHGVTAHVRTSRGRDVDAACGQLRRRAERTGA